MLNKNKIKTLMFGFLNVSLSLMILLGSLHLNNHSHNKSDNYNICSPECDSPNHHYFENNCEECVNNSNKQKLFLNTQSFSMIDTSNINLNDYVILFTNDDAICHYFGSRAPPKFL